MRHTFLMLACLGLTGAWAQSTPQFDAASVKPAPDLQSLMGRGEGPNLGTKIDGEHVSMGFISVRDLIAYAYGVKSYQVVGPDWMTAERFDIAASMPAGATKEQVPAMVQALLAQRFKMTAHRDDQAQPVYGLTVGSGGVKMKPAAPAAEPAAPAGPPPAGTQTIDTPDGAMQMRRSGSGADTTVTVSGGRSGGLTMNMAGGEMNLQAERMTMADLAQALSPMLDRPVVDETGLSGPYQVSLHLSPQDLMAAAQHALGGALPAMPAMPVAAGGGGGEEAAAPPGQSIFSSVQALGLRLEKQDKPLGRVVVDHIEKTPTAD